MGNSDNSVSKSRAELTDTLSVCSAIQSPLLECIMQVTNDTVTQQHLDAVHEGMRTTTQLWVSGLITDREVADHFAKLSFNFQKLEDRGLLSGLLDPATGLKY